ncbi:MAG: response regulator [Coleofasciculaceae cyanobacterium]
MKRILVIEDEGIIRLNLLQILNANGYEVIGAENGAVGLRLVREFIPNLIICNIKMPVLDGYEVFRELRSDAITAQISFIFLTAQMDLEQFSQEEQQTIRYLCKPFLSNELLELISEIIGFQST